MCRSRVALSKSHIRDFHIALRAHRLDFADLSFSVSVALCRYALVLALIYPHVLLLSGIGRAFAYTPM